jgi:DNA helicase-2/ATP-dependent DNA helicase PcrA
VTSVFLEELVASSSAARVQRGFWAEMPIADEGGHAVNPRLVEPVRHPWPDDPLAVRRVQLADGIALVAAALAAPSEADPVEPGIARELELLLTEREVAAARREVVVAVPRHLSASDVVQLATDRMRFALSLRRPMPAAPALAARRGTAFHTWVEQHYHRAAIVDVVDLPGSADETAPDEVTEAELARMKELFLASEWAGRVPEGIEIAVETVLDGFAIRGRIDAVFPRDGGGFTIVDWKTGTEPDARAAHLRTLQLAAYALAYARLRHLPARAVDAAFYYAQTGTTVRPRLPREAALRAVLATVPG